ncbi:MAG: M23 family metallopeptidase [Bdellovibrionia bacterium]
MITKKFVPVGQGGFFIANSPAKGSKKLFAPVNYIRLASTFHPSRLHPVTKRYQAHLGVDFELPEGAPILAAKSGRVVRFGYQKAAGNYIVLAHGNGIETYYNHLKSFAGNIRKGAAIKAGQVIGSNGCTGYCTKPHLHFALKKNGKMVDPLPFMKPYAAPAEKLIAARF